MTDKLRAAAEMVLEELTQTKYGLERNRVWGGMEWSYVPIHPNQYLPLRDKLEAQIAALRQALAEPDTTKMIDTGIDRGAWADVSDATKWVDELRGDEESPNSATDVVEPETAKETPQGICRTDGRCQYAIDSGAEGMGWCPEGKCVMPRPDVVEPEEWDHPPMRNCECKHCKEYWSDVYAASPKREWQGLTDEELNDLARWSDEHGGTFHTGYGKAIEAALKSKNGF